MLRHSRILTTFAVVVVAGLIIGCYGRSADSRQTDPQPAVSSSGAMPGQNTQTKGHVWIDAGGDIFYNRKKMPLIGLRSALHALNIAHIAEAERLPIRLLEKDSEAVPI